MEPEAERPQLHWSDLPLCKHQGKEASVDQNRFVFNSLKNFKNFDCLSACRRFDSSHTGLAIADKLMEVLKDFGIEDKTFHCLTDSAGNMIKGNPSDIEDLNIFVTLMFTLGLNDFNNLRTREIEAREDVEEETTNDPYCLEEQDNDPLFEEEIAIIQQELQEMEEQMTGQCGVHCRRTTRVPCAAHKASANRD